MQYNDLAFAGHAVIICAITLTQFIPSLWGFEKRDREDVGSRISNSMLGVVFGCFLGVGIVIFIVLGSNDDDPESGWGWIDAVRRHI